MKALLLVLIALSLPVAADNRSYFDLSAVKQNVNDNDFEGFSLVISKAIDKNVYLSWSMEKSIGLRESITTNGGLGVQFKSDSGAYVYGGIEYERRDNDEGALFKIGSSHYAFDGIELTTELRVSFVNIDAYVSSYSEIRYHLNKFTSIGLGFESEHLNKRDKRAASLSLRAGF